MAELGENGASETSGGSEPAPETMTEAVIRWAALVALMVIGCLVGIGIISAILQRVGH
jgi:hypothetical protein